MIGPGTGVRVYLACGVTDMRKGIAGLTALTQDVLRQKPASGAVFAFRGRRGDRDELNNDLDGVNAHKLDLTETIKQQTKKAETKPNDTDEAPDQSDVNTSNDPIWLHNIPEDEIGKM